MRKFTPILFFGFLAFCMAFMPQKAQASHAAGAEILYEHIPGTVNQYKVYFKFYRDCTGIDEPTSQNVCVHNLCDNTVLTVSCTKMATLPGGAPNGSPVSTGCPGVGTTCDTGSLPGFEEWWYEGTVTLPTQCNFWRFYAGISARNTTDNIVGGNLYVETLFNNQAAQGNSSPQFSVKPVPYVCLNQPYTFNNGAFDQNGDSLTYEMVRPRTGPLGCAAGPTTGATDLAWKAGTPAYNVSTNPLQTGNSFTLDPQTGALSFTPTLAGKFAIAVRVNEYRNGVWIGSILRDIQVQVLPCNIPQPSVNTVQSSISGAQLVNGRIEGCAGQPLSFSFDLVSPDTGAVLKATDNHATVIPGSGVSYLGQASDSIRGTFTWFPSALDTGLKVFTVSVKDSTCEPPGITIIQTFTIPIYIWPVTTAYKDTTICPGDTVHLNVVGGGGFVWTDINGNPPATLSCTNCKEPVASPTTTTQYVVTATQGNSFCNKNVDTVTITVVVPPQFDLGPDTTTCINDTLQLDANLVQSPGTTYKVEWLNNPPYLSDDTITNPLAYPVNDISYIIEITPVGGSACKSRDTINITVLQGYNLFTGDTAICLGQGVNVSANGDNRYNYAWTPNTPDINGVTSITPVITPSDTGKFTYTITASYPGCTDSVRDFEIEVQPVPTVNAGQDQILCQGDTVHLLGTVTPLGYVYTYSWTPGGAMDDPSTINPIYSGNVPGPETITFAAETSAGCRGTDDIIITTVPSDFLDPSDDETICPGETLQLDVQTTGGVTVTSIEWFPKEFIDNPLTSSPTVYPQTQTTYFVVGRDQSNCLDTQYVTINVAPDAVISVPDSVTIYPGESYNMDPRGNALFYSWSPSNGLNANNISNPTARPDATTKYTVYGRTEFGCEVQDEILVIVAPDSYIDVPNAFTPGSMPNSTLKAVRRGDATIRSFIIYNRWGNKVFETSDVNQGWDGTFNGEPQPMGVYIYTIDAVTPSGRAFVKQGNVTLIR